MAKFELYKDKSDHWRWNLKSGNGEIIAVSEGYTSKQAAKTGIKSVRRNSLFAKLIEV